MYQSFSIISSLFLFFITLCSPCDASFANNGHMELHNLNLVTEGTLDNNGELIGIESVNIVCDTLTGKGLIKAPYIAIKAEVFAFTGTIGCSGKCTIITKTPFDEKMFTHHGRGEIVIIVDEAQFTTKHTEVINTYSITDGLLFQAE